MAQDYSLQYAMLLRLKSIVDLLINKISDLDSSYARMIDSCYQAGLPEEMYKTMTGHKERVHAMLRNLGDKIENEDLAWIKAVEDGYDAVLSASGNAPVSAAESSGSTLGMGESGDSAELNKVEMYKRGTQKLKSMSEAAIAAASGTGKEENQRNIRADYLAAFIANQKQH